MRAPQLRTTPSDLLRQAVAFLVVTSMCVLGVGAQTGGGGITDPNATYTPGPLPLQPVGTPFQDPVFRTTLRRVSNRTQTGSFEVPTYSQLQAFSYDNA